MTRALRPFAAWVAAFTAFTIAAACSNERSLLTPPSTASSTAPPSSKLVLEAKLTTLPPPGGEVMVVTDAEALSYLDAHGLSFAERFAGATDPEAAHRTAKDLASVPRYASLVSFVGADIDEALAHYQGERPPAGTSSKTAREINDKYAVFNRAWLTSSATTFELVGVVNRFDRRVLDSRRATCGELRLIYRPSYRGLRESSRLPLTVVVVFPQISSSCATVARTWIAEGAKAPRGVAMAKWLTAGPLRDVASGTSLPIAFELNALVESWSRFVHESDGVGAHHRYSLRVFRPEGDHLAPEPLDNTPDVEAVLDSPPKKKALLGWIVSQRTAIERGQAFLPPLPGVGELRATHVSSLTAMGLTRASNRPYSRIFMDDLPSFRTAMGFSDDGQARAFLRVLDMATCNGCHVTRSVLGFHLPGDERDAAAYLDPDAHEHDPELAVDHDQPDNHPHDQVGAVRKDAPIAARVTVNRLAVGISAHLRDERDRRARDLRRYLEAGAPVNLLTDGSFESMPPPDRGTALKGLYAAPCAVGDLATVGNDAVELTCAPGHRCVPLDDSGYGQCIDVYQGKGDLRSVGDPFELQKYSVDLKGLWATSDPWSDRGPLIKEVACIGGGPTGRDKGFPFGGICAPTVPELLVKRIDKGLSTGCPSSDGVIPLGESAFLDAAGAVVSHAAIGAREVVCGLQPFRAAKTWGFMSTAAMVWNSVAPAFQPACDVEHPCRDEYVCMRRLPRAERSLRDPAQGTCQAGYVLAQLEIDAHKVP